MKCAIGYLRVSTSGQMNEDKYGLEAQKQAILSYAHIHGYQIVEWAKDVISGVKEDRPAFNTLLYAKEIGNPPYEAVICFKSDRVARDIKLYFYFLFLLERKGVKLISVNEDFDDNDPLVNVQRALMIFVAEQERRNIALRTTAGRRLKKAKGGYIGGTITYGYKNEFGTLQPNPVETPVVKMIFEMRENQKLPLQAICDYLNGSGIKTRRGKNWERITVKKVVDNKPFYQGMVKYNGEWVKGEHEAIL